MASWNQQPTDPILDPLIKAAKEDTDYQLIIKALGEVKSLRGRPYMTSDARGGEGGLPKSDFKIGFTNKTSDEGGRGGQKTAKII